MSKDSIILIVGETGSGKDTVVRKLGLKTVISSTTRPRRSCEVNGREHYFISEEEMDNLESSGQTFAWTRIGKFRYCATLDEAKNKDVYIIDPNGIKWYKEHSKDSNLRVIVIGITLPLEERRRRCFNRSDFYSDFEDRVKAEQPSFDEFKKSGDFNYLITNWDSTHTADIIKMIFNYELKCSPRRL